MHSHRHQAGGGRFDLVGLSIGQAYEIQIISVGDARTCCSGRLQTYAVASGELSRFDPASVVGHFVADATTQSILVAGATDPGLSGYQGRTALPGPSSAMLLGLSGLALALRRRR